MFNNDSPYPNLNSGQELGIKLFTDFVNKDLKENKGKQDCVLSFKNASQNRKAFTYNQQSPLKKGSAMILIQGLMSSTRKTKKAYEIDTISLIV